MSVNKTNSDPSDLRFLKNALYVAGMEMGPEGEHWPAVNATIRDIDATTTALATERDVQAEMKKHLYAQLEEMERLLPACSKGMRETMEEQLRDLREVYDAHFAPVADEAQNPAPEETPLYLKRAEVILETLGGKND